MREATRLFASNMNPRMAQRFFNLVLLPAVQDDIRDNKKLNFHLYLALKKALYKPAAFFKGNPRPLTRTRTSTRTRTPTPTPTPTPTRARTRYPATAGRE